MHNKNSIGYVRTIARKNLTCAVDYVDIHVAASGLSCVDWDALISNKCQTKLVECEQHGWYYDITPCAQCIKQKRNAITLKL